MAKIKNIAKALVGQLPLKRFVKNFFVTGNAWGMFNIRSHQRENGTPKVMYNRKSSADRSAGEMGKKHGKHFSSYKCVFCDGYHLGKNRDNK